MDILIETNDGRRFKEEIPFFSTTLQIKEQLHRNRGFSVSRQTLIFDGKIMEDERDLEYYNILQGSRILLDLAPEPGPTFAPLELAPSPLEPWPAPLEPSRARGPHSRTFGRAPALARIRLRSRAAFFKQVQAFSLDLSLSPESGRRAGGEIGGQSEIVRSSYDLLNITPELEPVPEVDPEIEPDQEPEPVSEAVPELD